MDWSRFQLVALSLIVSMVALRALLLWFTIRVNAFKITCWTDLAFVAGAAAFGFFLMRATRVIVVPLPAWLNWLDTATVNSEAARIAGASIVAAGIVIFVLALLSFGNSWRVGIDNRTSGPLVTSGLFAFSRNPIFVFMDGYLAGTFLLNGTVFFLLIALIGIAGLHFQIRREERFLKSRHGNAYEKYCERTPRYVL